MKKETLKQREERQKGLKKYLSNRMKNEMMMEEAIASAELAGADLSKCGVSVRHSHPTGDLKDVQLEPEGVEENWIEEFDKNFSWGSEWEENLQNEIKQFISSLLDQQKKEIGEEFKKWLLRAYTINERKEFETFEQAILRITGVKI